MQNMIQRTTSDRQKRHEEQSATPAAFYNETESSTLQWPNLNPNTEILSELQSSTTDSSESEQGSVSEVLLAMESNVEDCGITADSTLLLRAARNGNLGLVNWLLKHRIDVNTRSSFGNTPFVYGCIGGHEKVVRVLLQAGAYVETRNKKDRTPLMETAKAGHIQVAKILFEHGANIDTCSYFKESALKLANYHRHLEMSQFLTEASTNQRAVRRLSVLKGSSSNPARVRKQRMYYFR